jgi:G:T-mismatch repair DNA endonuclease (very short patch repair protein)
MQSFSCKHVCSGNYGPKNVTENLKLKIKRNVTLHPFFTSIYLHPNVTMMWRCHIRKKKKIEKLVTKKWCVFFCVEKKKKKNNFF